MAAAHAPLTYRFYHGLDGLDSIHTAWLALAERLGPRKGLPHIPFWYRC